jgi:hypothetical protein
MLVASTISPPVAAATASRKGMRLNLRSSVSSGRCPSCVRFHARKQGALSLEMPGEGVRVKR